MGALLPTPNLGDDQIMRVITGLRPCRRGGLRIEAERLGSKIVVHNYGQGGCGVTIGFGCAVLASDIVEQHAPRGAQVVVLGAGVVGLTTARELLGRGYRVRVIGREWLAETTSNIAGAIWLPTGLEPAPTADARAQFDRVQRLSLEQYSSIDRTRFGVQKLPVYEPDGAEHHAEYFRPGILEAPTTLDALPLAGPRRSGRVFWTEFVHTPRFLRELKSDIERAGGVCQRGTLTNVDDVRGLEEDVIVNSLALGSRTVFGDEAMFAAYGLLVLMKPQPLGYIVHDGYKYMFPREDALILGGCFRPDVWTLEPDERLAAEILAHHRAFFGLGDS